MSRRRGLAVVAGVAVASASVSWVAASRITPPDEAQRKAKPPKASLITVPVEKRALSANLVLRGGLSFDEETTISVPSAGSSGGSATTRVVTKDPAAVGTDIVEGQPIVEISGRPVIALQGALPVFRDLVIGSTGDDVEQLEAALARLGHDPGVVDGTFDAQTQAGIESLYRSAGYQPRALTDEQSDRVDEARKAAQDAAKAVRAAEKAANEARTPKRSERLRLDNELDAARRAVDKAKSVAARARADGPVQIADAQAELDAANAAKRAADGALAAANAPGAVNPATGDPYTPAEVAELESAVAAARTDVTAKTKAVTTARTAAADAVSEADAGVVDAEAALRLSFATTLEAVAPRGDEEVAAVDDARRAASEAIEDLAEAEGAADGLPQAEVVFVRSLPRRVGSVALERGDVASGALMTVSGSNLAVRTSVTTADRTLVKAGTEVTITEPDLDLRFDGVVASVADQPRGSSEGGSGQDGSNGDGQEGSGSDGDSADRFDVVITPGELPADVDLATLEGLNFRITIPVKSTDGEVLAVPAAALSATGDDQVQVEVVDGSSTRFVTVTRGLAAQGFVEVSASDGGRLEEGDDVVVGR